MNKPTFKARAKTPGRCALAGCQMAGDKIYEADGLRLLSCSEGHAVATLQRIDNAVKRVGANKAQRDEALRLFNLKPLEPLPVTAGDDFDIPL